MVVRATGDPGGVVAGGFARGGSLGCSCLGRTPLGNYPVGRFFWQFEREGGSEAGTVAPALCPGTYMLSPEPLTRQRYASAAGRVPDWHGRSRALGRVPAQPVPCTSWSGRVDATLCGTGVRDTCSTRTDDYLECDRQCAVRCTVRCVTAMVPCSSA